MAQQSGLMVFFARYNEKKGWRVIAILEDGERDICGAIDERTARETALCLTSFRGLDN